MTRARFRKILMALPLTLIFASVQASAGDGGHLPGYNTERNAYFGDLHVHTKLSFDAYIFNVRASPDDAYRFAKGEPLGHASGMNVRLLGGPLDFVAVTDHSEYIGALREADTPGTAISKLPVVDGLFSPEPGKILVAFNRIVSLFRDNKLPPEFSDKEMMGRAWTEVQDAAARHNQPGKFTTFVGYEFTSAPDGRNLHRNVIFRSAKVPTLPYTATDSKNPEDLWAQMDKWRDTGVESLAIPHNSNGSDGLMFEPNKFDGKPVDKIYADLRARNEPLVEITQIKGTSETHPSLSPNDEWSNFEVSDWYIGSMKKVTKFDGGYVRKALLDGLVLAETKGGNPFRFGFIGSSDTHNATPGLVEEANYYGKVGRVDGLAAARGSVPPNGAKTWDGNMPDPVNSAASRYKAWGAAGLAAVWAEENTREAIFAAMRRKETFATSGPHLRLRFFASYEFPSNMLSRADAITQAYKHGVPMGGDLLPVKGKAPNFMLWAMRDPNSGFLQRIQVVKGWIEDGKAKEQVFDVACSDGHAPDKTNWRCPDNGASVNLTNCEPDRMKGDVELKALWADPAFKPEQRAFYYARVLENPSCRWSTWDAIRNGTPVSPDLQMTIQERAWSSPIWYSPS